MSGLPTGTVTLLLADVEGSTRLWETQPEQMTAAMARLDETLAEIVGQHDGVRPVEQGEGDSFVIAFARASDAVACALALQRAPLAPIRLRIGVHTGEIQLRDEGNYIGPSINRTARLRDLAHGGQTVLSGTTNDIVVDRLPADSWLTDLGAHTLRDLPRPERVVQLCHSDLRNDFPPLRTGKAVVSHRLPPQLTRFVGRGGQIGDVCRLVSENSLVTLTGAGGVGKTRMAVEIAGVVADRYDDGVGYVDLAPVTDPDVVPATVARALGLSDQPGRSAAELLTRYLSTRSMLLVLDNCEHLLDSTAELIEAVLGAAGEVTLLTTSREPIGVGGEVTWRVPSLSLADEAIELFADRARRVRPNFTLTEDNTATVTEICRRLDGMPLAIELAAARVRALSLEEIVGSLHDRFRLLTGGSRTAVRRQQTLRASVDWSHTLLTEPERVLFRRLAAFMGGFDLDAAQFVGGGGEVERYQVLDQLTLLVDKSLVVAEESERHTRYRLLETVRQYAAEKLGESGEADAVRARHRDHYAQLASLLDTPSDGGHDQRIAQADNDIDNFRAAFAWSVDGADTGLCLRLASSLQPLWLGRGRIGEGLAWFDAALAMSTDEVDRVALIRALADKAVLQSWVGDTEGIAAADKALALARESGDPALLARALTARGTAEAHKPGAASPYFTEAIELVRDLGDQWRLCQLLGWQGYAGTMAGDPVAARCAGQEGRDLALSIGDRFEARQCRWHLANAHHLAGELASAEAELREGMADAEADRDVILTVINLVTLANTLAYRGDPGGALAVATEAISGGGALDEFYTGIGYAAMMVGALASADVELATRACQTAAELLGPRRQTVLVYTPFMAQTALACGDLGEAKRRADEAVEVTRGYYRALALTVRSRVALAEGSLDEAERDAFDALTTAGGVHAHIAIPDSLECLAGLACAAGRHREAARLYGAADAIRKSMGSVRFKVDDAAAESSMAAVRKMLGDTDFDAAFKEGAALSVDEAVAYALRGRGERKRPASGWAALAPTELDVVRLLGEGLANKEIGARLFISPRTVQTHLTHVYAKLGLSSRVAVAREAARHGASGADRSDRD